jgi:hypothetical protein
MNIFLQYRGKRSSIYALIIEDGTCPAIDFLEQLKFNNPASHKSLVNVLTRHADTGVI